MNDIVASRRMLIKRITRYQIIVYTYCTKVIQITVFLLQDEQISAILYKKYHFSR